MSLARIKSSLAAESMNDSDFPRAVDPEFFVELMASKDEDTRRHCSRVATLAWQLAVEATRSVSYASAVKRTAMVHDVGKLGIPAAILCKPGPLTEREFAVVRQHPEIGCELLRGARVGTACLHSVLCHHERWDGAGYPNRVAGPNIPTTARIIAIADAYDAMVSDRVYRAPRAHGQALEEISRCAATQFDPSLAATFCQMDFELQPESPLERTSAA